MSTARKNPPPMNVPPYYEHDLGRNRGVIRIIHHGDHLEIKSLTGRLVIRPSVTNVVYVTAEPPK